jgi:glycosyltransferase involved in cell wall biosynthesis
VIRTGNLKPLVSVLTPSIPERAVMLAECRASVSGQTLDVWEHLVAVDEDGEGCAVTMNRLADEAIGKWLLPLADDDLLLPGCLAALVRHTRDADVIYSPPLVTGNEDRWWFYQEPPAIPSFALIRTELWEELGGYDESLTREEDRNMWVDALKMGARFFRVDEPTWVYRQWKKADGTPGNKSFAGATG